MLRVNDVPNGELGPAHVGGDGRFCQKQWRRANRDRSMLHQFPFRLRGFHCDNGSEFLNHTMAKLLNKLLGGIHQIAGLSGDRQRAGGKQE